MPGKSAISVAFRITEDKDGLKTLTMDAAGLRKIMSENVKVAQQLQKSIFGMAAATTTITNFRDALSQISSVLTSLTEESNQFGKAMREANTMAGKDAAGFKELKNQVADLAKEIPLTRDLLANGLYQTISNGVPEDNWMTFLQTSARSAVGGLADINQVVGVTSTIIKNYGLEWENAADIQDKIQLTAKNGVTSFEQLAAALPRVTGNAATLGVSIDELMGSFATLTGVSGNTAEVSTQLAAIFTALVKPSSEAAKMAAEMGIQFDAAAIKAAGGFRNFLVQLDADVKDYAKTSGVLEQEVYAKLFGSAESLRALIPLQGELSDKFAENVANMQNSAGTMDTAFNEMNSTGSAALQTLKNKAADFFSWFTNSVAVVQPFVSFGAGALGAGANVMILATTIKQLNLQNVRLVKGIKNLIATKLNLVGVVKKTSQAIRVLTVAEKGSAASAIAMKVAIRGLLITTGVGAAIAALTTIICAFSDSADEATDKVEELDDATDAYKHAAADAKVQIDKDIKALGDLIKAKGDTREAVEKLNKTYGEFFGTQKTAEDWYKVLTERSQAYVKQMGYEAQARALASKVAEASIEREMAAERKVGLEKSGKHRTTQSVVAGTSISGAVMSYTKEIDTEAYKQAKKEISDADAKLAALQKKSETIGRLMKQNRADLPTVVESGSKDSDSGDKGNGKGHKGTPVAPAGSIADLGNKIQSVRTKIEYEVDPASRAALYKELTDLEYHKHTLEFEYKHPDSPGKLTEALADMPTPKIVPEIDVAKITPVIEDVSGAFDDLGQTAEKSAATAADAFGQLGSSISSLGNALELPELNVAGTMAQAIATMVQGYATATAEASAMGPWGWIAFAATGLAQLAAMISSVKSMGAFATGGIVGGTSKTGDKLIARVNSGEMILNATQQRNLFRMLNTPRVSVPQPRSITPQPNAMLVQSVTREPVIIGGTIKLRNRDLVVALANETRIASKSGRRTNIKI